MGGDRDIREGNGVKGWLGSVEIAPLATMTARVVTLQVDFAAEQALARIFSDLRSARLEAGLSQNSLATQLPVRGRAVSEWETGAIEPTLDHLIQWARELGKRLVILGPDGGPLTVPLRRKAGETWDVFERRRLAIPLRNRRMALRLTQTGLGRQVGVSRDSIQRWELVRVPPRPISHIVWAQELRCSLGLQAVGTD
jgi:transcriptional regulator with XRE-family HTH domain